LTEARSRTHDGAWGLSRGLDGFDPTGSEHRPVQTLLQVGPQVLDVLDPDAEPDQPLRDRCRLGLPPPPSLEGRLHATERRRVHPQRRRPHQPVGPVSRIGAADEHDRDDPAEARVTHLLDLCVRPQPVGEGAGVALGPVDAEVQCAQPAQRQPGLQRAGDRPHQVAAALQHVVQLVIGGDQRPEHGVGVTGQVLGRGVHHDVGAHRQRLLAQRCGERVVDHDVRAGVVGDPGDRLDVGDLQCGVGR
jgi:hypothetical protein